MRGIEATHQYLGVFAMTGSRPIGTIAGTRKPSISRTIGDFLS